LELKRRGHYKLFLGVALKTCILYLFDNNSWEDYSFNNNKRKMHAFAGAPVSVTSTE